MFDPSVIVDHYMESHPKLKNMYRFNGLWKPSDNPEKIVVILTQQIKKNWGTLGKVINST